jgi:putative hydrolase of the HAD superfamily
MYDKIKIIAFDADDTLWVNEPYYQRAENKFCEMLEDFLPNHTVSRELLTIEIKNLKAYGYGIKSFILSMIETAIKISNGMVGVSLIEKILDLGREMINQPIEIMDGVEDVLQNLHGKYRLVMATKGDLLDQERKLYKSGLENYFHHTEIVSEKTEKEYQKLIKHLDIQAEEFLMIGNSLKSDVIPLLNIGAFGFHVPYHTTWEHEKVDIRIENDRFQQLNHIGEVLNFIH